MHPQTLLALWLGKFIQIFLKLFPQFGGRAAPGLIALKIDPRLVKNLSAQIPIHIMISGTNGKTTTTKMVYQILKKEKFKIIINKAGSNLSRGLASSLIRESGLLGKLKHKIAVWEIDEFALLELTKQIKPQILVLTNLFRDQLDRYGEIDTIAQKWKKAIKSLPKKSTLILNADDPTLSSFSKLFKNSFCFGFAPSVKLKKKPEHASDATLCPLCLKPLTYKSVSYSHLGNFKPCSCSFTQSKKQIIAKNIFQKQNASRFDIKVKSQTFPLNLPLPGTFNIYNALAALAVAQNLNLSLEKAIKTLENFKAAFGRSEEIKASTKAIKLMLIKNPTGFNQVIDMLTHCRPSLQNRLQARPVIKKLTLLIAINDKIADGRDVSWLWDANIEKLSPYIKKAIISGTRVYDMALRAKYASHQSPQPEGGQAATSHQQKGAVKQLNNGTIEQWKENTIIEPDLNKAVNTLLARKDRNLFILPTYTAMLEIREILRKKGLVESSWKE